MISPSSGFLPYIPLCLIFLMLQVTSVTATISVQSSQFTIELPSMPAKFGMNWRNGIDYFAQLQLLPEHLFLCHDDESASVTLDMNSRLLSHGTGSLNSSIHSTNDGVPVALLVSRGECSFEEKARMAMQINNVAYVIVFDDRVRPTTKPNLVPMSATDATGIDMGMLFVSYASGMHLVTMIHDQFQNVTDAGGILIKMDAVMPNIPIGENDTQQWILAATAGFFTFLSCFGCLLMCVHIGLIPAEGSRAGFGRVPTLGASLLTEAQVSTLPLHEYKPNIEAGEQTTCAICLEEFEGGEKLRKMPCEHCFHHACIKPWLTERSASCPLCKFEISARELTANAEVLSDDVSPWWYRDSHNLWQRVLPTNLSHYVENPLLQNESEEDEEQRGEMSQQLHHESVSVSSTMSDEHQLQ